MTYGVADSVPIRRRTRDAWESKVRVRPSELPMHPNAHTVFVCA
jgi:hypothetical protein